jgi:hypothetical protein
MRVSCCGHMHAHVHVHACALISFLFFRWKYSRLYASLMCMLVSVFCLSTFMSMHASCQHTRAHACRDHSHTHAEITRTPLSCGGDECDADSLSLLRQSYIQTCVHGVCVCVYIYIYLFVCFFLVHMTSVCLPNSYVSPRYSGLVLENNQLSALSSDIFAGLSSLWWVCVFLVSVYRVPCLCESVECVWVCVRMSVYDSCLT